MRWIFGARQGPKLDVACSADAKTQLGLALSYSKFVTQINDADEQSDETAYRKADMKCLLDEADP